MEKNTFSLYPIPFGNAGGASFLNSLKKSIGKNVNYLSKWEMADLILLNSHHWIDSLFKLIFLRARGKKFIIRIDGPLGIYRNTFLSTFEDKIIYSIAKNLCSGIIYQSYWSSKQNKIFDKGLSKLPERIIYNSFLGKKLKNNYRKENYCLFVSNSSNPFKGFDLFKKLASKSKNIPILSDLKFFVIGNFNLNEADENINILGFKNKKDLSKWMNKSKFYIHPSKFEACSNALIESIYHEMIPFVFATSSNIEIVTDKRLQFSSIEELIQKIKNYIQEPSFRPAEFNVYNLQETTDCYLDFFDEIFLQNKKENKFNFLKLVNILYSYALFIIVKIFQVIWNKIKYIN